MKTFLIAGARPNFMKIAPIYRIGSRLEGVDCKIVHTGQHYDYQMSQAFFDDLQLPEPHFYLGAGSGSHSVQTAKIMTLFEELCIKENPDLVMVVGDVNSTLACCIVAKKLLASVAHIEAGLRSFDMTMPEEINRIVTDAISDYFFVTEESGVTNLLNEGKSAEKIHFVGNVMIDNLFHQLRVLASREDWGFSTQVLKGKCGAYGFLTLHRPSNVDSRDCFEEISEALNSISETLPILFPVHPRTRERIEDFGIRFAPNIHLLPPLGFSEALFLWKDAKIVLTDSGGLQEETTALGIPCITLRNNTERPITIKMGTNLLAGTKRESILSAYRDATVTKGKTSKVPPKWDGKAAERIWNVILQNHVSNVPRLADSIFSGSESVRKSK